MYLHGLRGRIPLKRQTRVAYGCKLVYMRGLGLRPRLYAGPVCDALRTCGAISAKLWL